MCVCVNCVYCMKLSCNYYILYETIIIVLVKIERNLKKYVEATRYLMQVDISQKLQEYSMELYLMFKMVVNALLLFS